MNGARNQRTASPQWFCNLISPRQTCPECAWATSIYRVSTSSVHCFEKHICTEQISAIVFLPVLISLKPTLLGLGSKMQIWLTLFFEVRS